MKKSEVIKKYNMLVNKMLTYKIDQIGAMQYAEELADLEEAYPEIIDGIE